MCRQVVGSAVSLFPTSSDLLWGPLLITIQAARLQLSVCLVPGFSILQESSGSPDLPLTMTMQSLWPWHHSRLWIINRGLDTDAGGLFVGKQGVISLSRQPDLMTCHKYIKNGKCSDILWPAFLTISLNFAFTFGLYSFVLFCLFGRSYFKCRSSGRCPPEAPMVSCTHHHEVALLTTKDR